MKCPRHLAQSKHVELVDYKDGDLSCYRCPDCGGILMSHRQLRALAERDSILSLLKLPAPHDVSFKSTEIDTNDVKICPIDGHDYYEHFIGQTRVDMCPECSHVWLDGGELEEIKAHLDEDTFMEGFIRKITDFLDAKNMVDDT